MKNEKRWHIDLGEILYLDDQRIVFRDEKGSLYVGRTGSIEKSTLFSAYTSEKIVFRCNELTLEGRTY